MAIHIENMTTDVMAAPESSRGEKGGGNSTKETRRRDLKPQCVVELRTRARGFDD